MPRLITVSGIEYIMADYTPGYSNGMDETYVITPMEQVVGFEVAEEIYDTLPFRHQLITDLLMAGYNQTQIAKALGISQPTVSSEHRRIRYHLANSKLKLILEMRHHDR